MSQKAGVFLGFKKSHLPSSPLFTTSLLERVKGQFEPHASLVDSYCLFIHRRLLLGLLWLIQTDSLWLLPRTTFSWFFLSVCSELKARLSIWVGALSHLAKTKLVTSFSPKTGSLCTLIMVFAGQSPIPNLIQSLHQLSSSRRGVPGALVSLFLFLTHHIRGGALHLVESILQISLDSTSISPIPCPCSESDLRYFLLDLSASPPCHQLLH